jgi:hypothetical protein
VPSNKAEPAKVPLRMTGTDPGIPSKSDKSVLMGVVPGVVTGRADQHSVAPMYTDGQSGEDLDSSPQVLEMERAGAALHRPASLRTSAPSRARTEDPLIKSCA